MTAKEVYDDLGRAARAYARTFGYRPPADQDELRAGLRLAAADLAKTDTPVARGRVMDRLENEAIRYALALFAAGGIEGIPAGCATKSAAGLADRILAALRASPDETFDATAMATRIGHPYRGSVATTLNKLVQRGLAERAGYAKFRAKGA